MNLLEDSTDTQKKGQIVAIVRQIYRHLDYLAAVILTNGKESLDLGAALMKQCLVMNVRDDLTILGKDW